MDITPTYHMFKHTNQAFASGYYHWFFLIQPDNLPETLIGSNARYYLEEKLKRWSAKDSDFNRVFQKEAVEEYVRCFDKESIHATCEDYRAGASIDMEDDEKDRNRKIDMPLLILWGEKGFVNRTYDVLNVWNQYASDIRGKALDCGHFLVEEKPADVCGELMEFFSLELSLDYLFSKQKSLRIKTIKSYAYFNLIKGSLSNKSSQYSH
ncbi:MAG: alpha/beta hydrolase [Aliarcobacter sp.]|nr:alpha/beta hydrolase [Aliarcobacter sp.]